MIRILYTILCLGLAALLVGYESGKPRLSVGTDSFCATIFDFMAPGDGFPFPCAKQTALVANNRPTYNCYYPFDIEITGIGLTATDALTAGENGHMDIAFDGVAQSALRISFGDSNPPTCDLSTIAGGDLEAKGDSCYRRASEILTAGVGLDMRFADNDNLTFLASADVCIYYRILGEI